MVPSAYLRVFQPLEGFERNERAHWERYILEARRTPARAGFVDREIGPGLGLLAPIEDEHAEVRIVGDTTYVSPHRMRMRVLAAIVSARDEEPAELWEKLVSKKEARRARRELARHRRRDPRAASFVHASPWHVPIRWFALFRDDERTLLEDERGRMRLRYRTTTRRAMRRAGNAIPVLRRSELGSIGELLIDLYEWMAAFDQRSLVELDYGELCDFMTWDELDDDHSAADVQAALDALSKHEVIQAAEVYQGVLGRWAEVRGRELMN